MYTLFMLFISVVKFDLTSRSFFLVFLYSILYHNSIMKLVQISDSRFYYDMFPRSHDGCKAAASNYGLAMASIHSDAEANMTYNENSGPMWIGAYRTRPGNSVEWKDGTQWEYDH